MRRRWHHVSSRFGKQLLDALIKDAKVDGSPLMDVLLGTGKR